MLFYTGLRVGELTALDTDDVALSARKGLITVRSGEGGKMRDVPLMDPQPARYWGSGWLSAAPVTSST